MSIKRFAVLPVIVLVLGCAASTVSVGRSDGDMSGRATAALARESDSESAANIDLDVTQTAAPPVMGNQTTADVQYTFAIKNRGTEPMTVRRITIWSAGGSYAVENWSRTFKKTIAPGETAKLPFWARLNGVSSLTGTDAPITLRAELQLDEPTGSRKATFIRNVGGNVSIGVSGQ